MGKRIFLHAGAHRTGTSSFQLCLYENRAALAAAGYDVAYPGRDGAPEGRLRLQLPRKRHGMKRVPEFAARLRPHLHGFSPDPDRALILSEENIPGLMRHFYDGLFYPGSDKRLLTVAETCGAPSEHCLFILRSYDELFVSAYRKRAEDNPVPPFAELVPQFMAMDRGWPELVAELRDLLKPGRLTVLPYERRGSSVGLLRRLVPDLEHVALTEPGRSVNLSATDAALEALQTRYRAGETLKEAQWRRVIADHADDRAPRGFAAFDPQDRDALRARYAQDLERIAAMPGVDFP